MRIWFNSGSDTLWSVARMLRHADNLPALKIIGSHIDRYFVLSEVCDISFKEPRNMTVEEYFQFCLETCANYQITHFFPSRYATELSRYTRRFVQAGVELMVPADFSTLQHCENKSEVYHDLHRLFPAYVPEYSQVTSAAEFKHALRTFTSRGIETCFKPAVGRYGDGFRRISKNSSLAQRYFREDHQTVSPDEAIEIMEHFDQDNMEVLLMEFLPGVECRMDLLLLGGKIHLATCLAQVPQTTNYCRYEVHQELLDIIQVFLNGFDCTGIINVQFRANKKNEFKLLEINMRMSDDLPNAFGKTESFVHHWLRYLIDGTLPETSTSSLEGVRVMSLPRPRYV